MPIHHLHEPIDVFSEWLDDCEAAQQGRAPEDDTARPPDDDEEDDDDDDLGAASGLQRTNAHSKPASHKSTQGASSGQPSYSALGLDDSDDSDDE